MSRLLRQIYIVLLCGILFSGMGLALRSNKPPDVSLPDVAFVNEPIPTSAVENGDCIFTCSVRYKTPNMGVMWMRNGNKIPITVNERSLDESLYHVIYSETKHELYQFDIRVKKVTKQDGGSTFQCLVFNSTDLNPNNRTKLLNGPQAGLTVLRGPKPEYPICSGKPMNWQSKTFSLSCCAEKVETLLKLEWTFSNGNHIKDHKPMYSNEAKSQFCVHQNLSSVHNGASYMCHLSAARAQGLNRSCKITYLKPLVRLEQMDSQQAKFKCSAPGANTYNWNFGDESSSQYVVEAGSSSMILNLNTVHNGTFITCTAVGKDSMGSDGIMLIMGRPLQKDQSMTLILGAVMGTIAGLLAVILIIYLIKMNAFQKCCGETEFPSLEFRTIIRMRGSQANGQGSSSYYVVQSTSASGQSTSMHPLMAERESANSSRMSTSGYSGSRDSLQTAGGAVGGAVGGSNFAGNYYELRKAPRPGGHPMMRGATCRDYYNDPIPPPRPPKPGLTDPRRLNVEGLDYADLDLVDVAEEEEDFPMKLPEEQTDYADILRIPSLRHSSVS